MSSSMWAWRVIVPGVGLVACTLVFWRSTIAEPLSTSSSTRAGTPTSPGQSIAPRMIGDRVIAEGRIASQPGAEVTLGAEAVGQIVQIPVREKSRVHKGDLLVEFRPDDFQTAVTEAEAKVFEVDAEVAFLRRKYQIYNKSPSSGLLFQMELEDSRHDLEVNLARRRGAVAALDRAKSALGRLRVTSPIDGVVVACHVRVGEIAAPAAPLVTVCDLSRVRVEAEVDEFDVARIGIGDDVLIKAEGYGQTSWRGTVEEIPDRVGGRTLRPEDPGRPSDTRVLLVKVALEGPTPLKLGQQVEVEIRRRP